MTTSSALETVVRPTITGPAAWPAAGEPPRFAVHAVGLPLYMVELASDQELMRSMVARTPHNYFFGGDAESVFATGPGWCVPEPVWRRLGRTSVLYYRVVVFDQASGTSQLSVDDEHLGALPALIVEGSPGPRPR